MIMKPHPTLAPVSFCWDRKTRQNKNMSERSVEHPLFLRIIQLLQLVLGHNWLLKMGAPCFLFPEWCFSFPWGHFSRIGFFCPRGVFLFRSVFLVPRNLFFCPWNRFECYWNRFFGSPWYFRCPEGFFLCPTEMKCPRVFLVPVSFGNIDFVAWFNEKRFTKQRYGRC